MNIVYQSNNGKIIHGDNIEVMKTIEENSIDSCISDFPYAIEFMGKNWDSAKHWNTGEGKHGTFEGTGYSGKKRPAFYLNTNEDKLVFYDWCYERAIELYRIMKPGGYVCIFGHPKTNHRMKSAFEDAGFNIVEEIDWVYLTGMPKNQDISKLFDKKAGVQREIIGSRNAKGSFAGNALPDSTGSHKGTGNLTSNKAIAEQARIWNGWKTAGLKPAHEPITVFQKPLEGTYIQNIEKYGCGGMNIDACRVPISQEDIDMLNAKASKNPTTNYSDKEDRIYGKFAEDKAVPANPDGRFPPNVIIDEYIAKEFDKQTGTSKSTGGTGRASRIGRTRHIYGAFNDQINEDYFNPSLGGYGDVGGGSRLFTIIKYCPKVSPKERKLPNGERNPHVTLKPVELIKWLIKLVTPKDGTTIDITAGSCTHAVAVEELNKEEGYNLKYINIELMNTEKEPYCDVGKMRVENIVNKYN